MKRQYIKLHRLWSNVKQQNREPETPVIKSLSAAVDTTDHSHLAFLGSTSEYSDSFYFSKSFICVSFLLYCLKKFSSRCSILQASHIAKATSITTGSEDSRLGRSLRILINAQCLHLGVLPAPHTCRFPPEMPSSSFSADLADFKAQVK